MSAKKKKQQEGEFEKQYSSEKGAWSNAWSPSWEDTSPSIAVRFDFPGEELPGGSDSSAAGEQEETE